MCVKAGSCVRREFGLVGGRCQANDNTLGRECVGG